MTDARKEHSMKMRSLPLHRLGFKGHEHLPGGNYVFAHSNFIGYDITSARKKTVLEMSDHTLSLSLSVGVKRSTAASRYTSTHTAGTILSHGIRKVMGIGQ